MTSEKGMVAFILTENKDLGGINLFWANRML